MRYKLPVEQELRQLQLQRQESLPVVQQSGQKRDSDNEAWRAAADILRQGLLDLQYLPEVDVKHNQDLVN
jgi:hypothetical protein